MLIPPACFNVDPRTLRTAALPVDYFASLYAKYHDELAELTRELAPLRTRMMASGYGADLGDMEAEILYLLLRELRPDTIVEMSPCHGYSTNYILAALTRNQAGRVVSLEITAETNGKPTPAVIAENLLGWVDRSRFELRIGDATKATVLECDFAFIDSCHESWFAAWYAQALIPRAKLCFVHDIVVHDETTGSLIPKASTTGIRESYYLLHALALAKQPFAAVAQIEKALDRSNRAGLAPRKGFPERSIIFPGHRCGEASARSSAAQLKLFDLRQSILFGDRLGAIAGMREIAADNPDDAFTRLHAYHVIPELGYRAWAFDSNFPDVAKDIDRCLGQMSDVSTLVAALELGTKLGYSAMVNRALKEAAALDTLSTPYFETIYRQYSFEFNRWAAAIHRRLHRARPRKSA